MSGNGRFGAPSRSMQQRLEQGKLGVLSLKTGPSYGRILGDHVWPDRGDHRGTRCGINQSVSASKPALQGPVGSGKRCRVGSASGQPGGTTPDLPPSPARPSDPMLACACTHSVTRCHASRPCRTRKDAQLRDETAWALHALPAKLSGGDHDSRYRRSGIGRRGSARCLAARRSQGCCCCGCDRRPALGERV